MGLIKKRPQVRLSAPTVLIPGERFEATVIVEADRPVPVNAITVELNGFEDVEVGSGDDATSARTQVARFHGELSGPTELQQGVRNYPFVFALPKNAPPTFGLAGPFIQHVRVRYSFDVRVDIPWWPDRRASFRAVVGYAPRPEPRARPLITESNPLGRGAHLELSLASDVFSPGDEISGAIALGNRSTVNYRAIEVALVADCARKIGKRTQTDEFSRSTTGLRLPEGEAALEFRQRLPRTIKPSFKSRYWSLSWSVEVTARVAGGRDVVARVPVQVEPSPSSKPRRRLAPPLVGRERVDSLWRDVAAHHQLTLEASELKGRLGQCAVTIARGTGEHGNRLVAQLDYPTLGLGLFTRKRVFAEREIGGRDEGQTQWLVARLPRYDAIEVEVSDERTWLRQDGLGQDDDVLDAFITAALRFASQIPKPAEVPAAESMKPRLPQWHELANVLEGTLNVGDLSVSGMLGGCRVSVSHRWPRRGPAKTLMWARPPGALRTPNVELKWDALGAEAQPLRQKGASLRALDDRLVLEAPLQLEAAPLLPKLRALAKLARGFTV